MPNNSWIHNGLSLNIQIITKTSVNYLSSSELVNQARPIVQKVLKVFKNKTRAIRFLLFCEQIINRWSVRFHLFFFLTLFLFSDHDVIPFSVSYTGIFYFCFNVTSSRSFLPTFFLIFLFFNYDVITRSVVYKREQSHFTSVTNCSSTTKMNQLTEEEWQSLINDFFNRFYRLKK